MTDREALEMFLKYRLNSPDEVFKKFLELENASYYEHKGYTDCVYVPGKRQDRVLLVAHADTVWDGQDIGNSRIVLIDGADIYVSLEEDIGIGADDRAGCAILWLLKDTGHSLLITNGEELGSQGAMAIRYQHKELFDELNSHQYILSFDRRNSSDYKVYDIPVTEEFKEFIERNTGCKEADRLSFSDITVLCDKICGANLSVGYYDEHTGSEYLNFREWNHMLNIARKMLEPKQSKYSLKQKGSAGNDKNG